MIGSQKLLAANLSVDRGCGNEVHLVFEQQRQLSVTRSYLLQADQALQHYVWATSL